MKARTDNVKRGNLAPGPHPVRLTPAGKWKWLVCLVISVCLNLLLAGAAAFYLVKKPTPSPGEPADLAQPSHATASAEVAAPPNPVAALSLITNRFHWRKVESEDYPTYLVNLRAIGCPEETIRDILLADIEKLYETRATTLPIYASFWSCGPKREAAERARTQRQRAVEQEKAALVQQLL
ncbi:MAG TPA: hypothetical protein VNZ22_09750, partial [Bacillota bacterium]|nr:hypothetical protein [Bacillota bacterium]